MSIDSTYLRTSIVLPENTIDVQLPADSPVEDVVYELIRFLNSELNAQGRSGEWLTDADAVWTLERFGRRQLDGENSLTEQGVLDGERLWLSKNAKNETYPALVDDIAESVSKYQDRFPDWKYDVDGIKMSAWALGVLGSVLSLGSAAFISWAMEPDTYLRWPVIGCLVALTLLVSGLCIPLLRNNPSDSVGMSLLVIGYAATASAAFIAIPRPPGLWHIVTTGALVLFYAALMTPLTKSKGESL